MVQRNITMIKEKNQMKIQKIQIETDFGKLFLKKEGDKILAPFSGMMTLSAKKGEIYEINNTWRVSADGYLKLNKIASVSLVKPATIIIDGVERPNPYVERNKNTKAIETVNIRMLGIGLSPIGNIAVVDISLFYNVYTYFLQSLQKRVKDQKGAHLGTEDLKPQKQGIWVFYPIELPTGIWANLEDKEIIKCFDDHIQRQRFGDRIATKIVIRNVLKAHPAVAISQVEAKEIKDGDYIAQVRVYGFRHKLTTTQISEIAAQVEEGKEIGGVEVEKIEVTTEVETEEEKKIIEEEAKEEEREVDLFTQTQGGKNETNNRK